SASAKVICFIGKLGQRDRRISPDSGSLFQTIPRQTRIELSLYTENKRCLFPAHAGKQAPI
ncbi:hypothetical protein, partial [Pseudomonas sp. SST3]|uniref:hypothetical protein n=1 Tax=Pseudomonas sp. SST3 TaxID=2267882 RepID=UPI0019D676E1